MKTIGLIGGMSWESSAEYYRIINETVKQKLGGLHSAKILMYSVEFAEIEELQHAGKWPEAARILADAAGRLERGGADFVLLCTNTMHKVADEVTASVRIPLLHIADATADAVKAAGIARVGLLGTKFTMEEEFYKSRLAARHGFEVIIPDEPDRELVHRVIFGELCLGITREESRIAFRGIMARLVQHGAEGIILGCTEIPMLVRAEDAPAPLLDTTRIHAEKAVELALEAEQASAWALVSTHA